MSANNGSDKTGLSPELLAAYADGELAPAECRRVAQVLAAYRALPARARVDFCRQLMLDPGSEVPRFLAVAEELAGRCLEANRYLAAKLDGVTDLAEQIRQAIRGEAVEWSRPESPKRWAKVFNCAPRTVRRWFEQQKIRNRKLSTRSYVVAVGDLPPSDRDRYRPR